jgi:hypothetical protein
MGYRSDVTIVMYPKRKEDFNMLKLYADETFPDKFEVHYCEDTFLDEGFRYLMLEFDSIKWYEGYEGVDVYTRAFSEWDDKFFDDSEEQDEDNAGNYEPIFHYEFVRIGEDDEDIVSDRSNNSEYILNIERRAYLSI